MITLKPAHFGELIRLSPNWISDGHWALRRELVSNAAILATVDTARAFAPKLKADSIKADETDATFDRLVPTSDAPAWTVYGRITRYLTGRS